MGVPDGLNGRIEGRLVLLEERVSEVQKDVQALREEMVARIDGPPFERSMRGRLHSLESEASSSKAVHAAIDEMRANRAQSFTRNQKLVGLFVAVCALALQAITVLSVIHQ